MKNTIIWKNEFDYDIVCVPPKFVPFCFEFYPKAKFVLLECETFAYESVRIFKCNCNREKIEGKWMRVKEI